MNEYSIAEAKNGLPRLVREAEAGQDVRLTRRGKPVAVVVGADRYRALTSKRMEFRDLYRRFLQESGAEKEDLNPEEIFVRDDSPGREFSW